jgi:Xaa-Pro aminopeptidase
VPAADVYEAALRVAHDLGVAEWFQGYAAHHGPHIGHGIGLELDEPPVLGPGGVHRAARGHGPRNRAKLVVPQVGAVNLEDDVVVTQQGCDLLGTVAREVFLVDNGDAISLRPVAAAQAAGEQP